MIHRTNARQKRLIALSMFAACAVGIALWAWWISFDRPFLYPRPHYVAWDAVSRSYHLQGVNVAPGTLEAGQSLLIRLSARLLARFDGGYRTMIAVQLPYLIILIVSCGLIALRLGGASAGALAPWIAVFAPMTVGAAVQFDDMLALQAMTCAAMAMLVWSDAPGAKAVGIFTFVPVYLGVVSGAYFSNRLLFIIVFCCGAGSILLERWGRRLIKKQGRLPWRSTLYVLAAVAVGFWAALPINFDYLMKQAARPDFDPLSVSNNPGAIWACLSVWRRLMAGPALALASFVAVGVIIWRKRLVRAIPVLGWLLLPMILLTIISKRHDFYLVAAIPATYPLIALGAGLIKKKSIRLAAVVALLAAQVVSWGMTVSRPVDSELVNELSKVFEGRPYPYLVSPYFQKQDYQESIGRWIADTCEQYGNKAVFIDAMTAFGFEAFSAWRFNTRLRIHDLRAGQRIGAGPHCLLVRIPLEMDGDFSFVSALADYRARVEAMAQEKSIQWFDDNADRQLQRIEENAPLYAFAGQQFRWAMMVR